MYANVSRKVWVCIVTKISCQYDRFISDYSEKEINIHQSMYDRWLLFVPGLRNDQIQYKTYNFFEKKKEDIHKIVHRIIIIGS